MKKIYIVKDPATEQFVAVKEGETGFYQLDDSKRYNADYAAEVNAAMGHTDEDLTEAVGRSMFGTW
jgi:hypothetical protein